MCVYGAHSLAIKTTADTQHVEHILKVEITFSLLFGNPSVS